MKKTLSINLAGLVFNIDEDAYQILKNYLDSLSKHFENEIGKEEIIADIESRFAEEFNQKRTASKESISVEDVNIIIHTLGSSEEFSSEKENTQTKTDSEIPRTPRRLYRDTDNAIVAGVASGIANYFGTDPIFIRILFVIFTLAGGFAVPLYLILWVITPKAQTPAQRAEMKGEPLTLKAIEEHVKGMVSEGKEKIQSLEKKKFGQKLRSFFHEVIHAFKIFLQRFFSFFGSIIGFFVTAGTFIGIIFLAIASGIIIVHRQSPWLGIQYQNYISNADFFLGIVCFTGIFLFPLFTMFLVGVRLLTKRLTFNGYIVSLMMVLWAMSLIGGGIILSKIIPQVETIRNDAQTQNQGEEKTITPDISKFNNLKISGNYTVDVQEGPTFSMKAIGFEKDLEEMKIENNLEDLSVERNYHSKFCFFCERNRVKIFLTVPSSAIHSIEVNGSNTLHTFTLESENFHLFLDGANTVETNILAKQIDIILDGANTLQIGGRGTSSTIHLDGASELKANQLLLENLDITLGGVSKAEVNVKKTITGEVSDLGKINYATTTEQNFIQDNSFRQSNENE